MPSFENCKREAARLAYISTWMIPMLCVRVCVFEAHICNNNNNREEHEDEKKKWFDFA